MAQVKRLFHLFRNRFAGENSTANSLFKVAPFTYIASLFFGVPLITPVKGHHEMLSVVTLLLRCYSVYAALIYDFTSEFSIVFLNQLALSFLGFVTLWLFINKRASIISFLSSDTASAPKLRRTDILCPILCLGPLLLQILPALCSSVSYLYHKNKLVGSFFDFSPILEYTVFSVFFALALNWFQVVPLCVILYSLGYCVLYTHKMTVLASISSNWHCITYSRILKMLKDVSAKQEQFEATFGPFLFISLCYNFLSTVYFIYGLKLTISSRMAHLYYFMASCLLVQIICIGLIFFISICNEKVKKLSMFVSDQLESKFDQDISMTFLMVNYLQNKINSCINEPVTACKMVNVDRKIVLTIATSCVTFSVLFVQINDGALDSKP